MLYMRDIARVVPLNARPSHPRHHRLHHRIRNVNTLYAFPRILFIFVHVYKMTFMIFVPSKQANLPYKILPRTPLSASSARLILGSRAAPLGSASSARLIIGSRAASSARLIIGSRAAPLGSRATVMESSTLHVRAVSGL